MPWNYDEALRSWKELPDNYESDSLRQRVEIGYAEEEPGVMISNHY